MPRHTSKKPTISRKDVIDALLANDGSFAKLASSPDFNSALLADKDERKPVV